MLNEGMDSGDKASNKAMSAAHKYALLQVFCIPTEEPKDSENEHHEIEKKNSQSPSRQQVAGMTLTSGPDPIMIPIMKPTQVSSKHTTANQPSLGSYVVTFGKYKDRTIAEIAESEGPYKVSSYVQWLENDAKVKKKPMGQAAVDFIQAFDAYVGNSELDQALGNKETLEEKMERLKSQHPGVPGPKMPTAYKEEESPFDPNEPWP